MSCTPQRRAPQHSLSLTAIASPADSIMAAAEPSKKKQRVGASASPSDAESLYVYMGSAACFSEKAAIVIITVHPFDR